jgi:UDP-N-acetylglucosamine diphosphorylase / glucose-1-phosphate thymidylyltransferase / UDP-N-acetylgalactosamine diphosphorylase / glucosamine-1-phosphate N-acetyltransferase / galactosamine-1-phosphate N-acetyltransferase
MKTSHSCSDYLKQIPEFLAGATLEHLWSLPASLSQILLLRIREYHDDFTIVDTVAVHRTARIENGAIIKGPAIISENCFVGAHAYLRGGVFLGPGVTIGPSCEIKSSVLCQHTAIAHFNFVGDSIIGASVNIEAGAIIANHHNDRADKSIFMQIDSLKIDTGVEKFGAIVGDECKIGANAVLCPGTLLRPKTIVKRLQLVEQT